MKDKYITTEPPLDEPEIINYTHVSMKRDSKQADNVDIIGCVYMSDGALYATKEELVQQTFHLNQQSQDDNNDH